jgi:flagellar biosynthesis/type III secretory pathway protein FliH
MVGWGMSYESPITVAPVVVDKVIEHVNDKIIEKVMLEVGVEVNKEQLAHALKFDRAQYQKGYDDGYDDCLKDGRDKAQKDCIARQKGAREFAEKLTEKINQLYGGSMKLAKVIEDILEEMFPHY